MPRSGWFSQVLGGGNLKFEGGDPLGRANRVEVVENWLQTTLDVAYIGLVERRDLTATVIGLCEAIGVQLSAESRV